MKTKSCWGYYLLLAGLVAALALGVFLLIAGLKIGPHPLSMPWMVDV